MRHLGGSDMPRGPQRCILHTFQTGFLGWDTMEGKLRRVVLLIRRAGQDRVGVYLSCAHVVGMLMPSRRGLFGSKLSISPITPSSSPLSLLHKIHHVHPSGYLPP